MINKTRFIKWRMGAVLVLAATVSMTSQAELSPGQQVLKKASDHVASLSTLSLDAEMTIEALSNEIEEKYEAGYGFVFKRPSNIVIKVSDERFPMELYTDGKQVTHHIAELNQYTVDDTSMSPAEMIRDLGNPILRSTLSILAELAEEAPFARFLEESVEVTVIDDKSIDNETCAGVRIKQDGQTMDLWFTKGDAPTLKRIEPHLDELIQEIKDAEKTDEVSVTFIVKIDHWTSNKSLGAQLAFSPAKGTEKIDAFSPSEGVSIATALKRKAAPDINLGMLNGDTFSLFDKKGKEIVVLDFWAASCGPCRQAMPILHKVVKEFERKGVRMYAVNLYEDKETIQEFLNDTGLDLTVVLDTQGKAADDYHAQGIPQMVIVGRDGMVKKVHVGLSRIYEKDVRAELTELTK